jgi:HSP20 family protein
MTANSTNDTKACTPTTWRKPIYRVLDTADAHEIRIELPGVPKSGVSVRLEDHVLAVEGHREMAVPADWKSLHREIPDADYQLRLRLNLPVDENRLEARLEQGVLHLRLPVQESARPRQIEIQ